MSIDLWAIDAGAGEALLRQGEEWLLLSLDAEWQALPLPGPADAVRWSSSSLAVPVGRSYEDLDQVVADVREATLTALRPLFEPGATEVALLPREAHYRPPRSDERRQARAEFLGRAVRRRGLPEGFFAEVISTELGRLERCFLRWGYAPQDVPGLVATCFDRLFANSSGWVDDAALKTRLFVLAEELHRNLSSSPRTVARPLEAGDGRLEQLVGRRIAGLPQDVIKALAIWTDLDRGYWDIQVVLQFSPEELERRLRQAAQAIGLAVELLRVRLFAPGCQRAAQSMLVHRSNR